jgi:hypothetical protein
LATLNSDPLVTSILLSGGTNLSVSFAQFAAYGTALGKLGTADTLTVNGVTAANAAGVQGNGRVNSFSVNDTGSAIVANLDRLNADGKLSSIAISDSRTLTVPYANFLSDAAALAKLSGSYTLVVSGAAAAGATLVAANAHVSQFTVSDTLADIGVKLDQLEAVAKTGKLSAITVTDSGGTLTIPASQYSADADAIALMHGSYSIIQPAIAGAATINLIWDAHALAAPAQFRSAVTYAAQYIQSLITNPITININVGYGEVGGSTMGAGVLGAAGPNSGIGVSYAQFKTYLVSRASSGAAQTIVANLSAADPSNGGLIYVASAEEKALGLMSANASGVDGVMGFAADPNGTLFTYDPNNRAVAGKYDLIGVVEHEITHAMGRIAIAGTAGKWISALDVFRYSAPGVHNAAGNGYYSIDGGTTNLDWFSTSSDLADWGSSAGNDANNAYSSGGVVNQFTATDITELNALGYATSGRPPTGTVGLPTASVSSGLSSPALSFIGSPAVQFMTDEAPILDVTLNPPGGIEEIAMFTYGVNELRIDLQGAPASALVASDSLVDGQHAITLANRADTSHGLVLTNMTGTAADLMAHHVTFNAGEAFVG